MAQVLHPTIKWAQRKDTLYIEVGLPDIKNQKVQLKEESLQFSCEAQDKQYEFAVQFFAGVESESSKWNKTGLHFLMAIKKKDNKQPYWLRLTKAAVKNAYIQCDWDKWIDEDQEDQEAGKGLNAYDPEAMNNFTDSDDEEEANLEELEKEQPLE